MDSPKKNKTAVGVGAEAETARNSRKKEAEEVEEVAPSKMVFFFLFFPLPKTEEWRACSKKRNTTCRSIPSLIPLPDPPQIHRERDRGRIL